LFFTRGAVGFLPSRLLPHIVSGAEPLCLRIIFHTTSFQPAHEKTQPYTAMRFHGMAELFCSLIDHFPTLSLSIWKAPVPLTGFSFAQPPTGREYAGRIG